MNIVFSTIFVDMALKHNDVWLNLWEFYGRC